MQTAEESSASQTTGPAADPAVAQLSRDVARLVADLDDLLSLRLQRKHSLLAQWSGRLADQFNGTDFPKTQGALSGVRDQLVLLRAALDAQSAKQ